MCELERQQAPQDHAPMIIRARNTIYPFDGLIAHDAPRGEMEITPRLWLGVPALAVLCSNSALHAVAEGIEYKSAQQSVRTMMFMSTTDVTDTFGLMSVAH